MQKYQNKQSGFSLIELAIVVVVVALLTVAILKSKTIVASFKCLGGSSQYSSNISLKDRADKLTQVMDGNLADAESEINNLNNSKGSFKSCVDKELDKTTSGSSTIPTTPVLSCKSYIDSNSSAISGEYIIDPDGSGPIASFNGYCDMTTDGGGWLLVLNYLHDGNTNPPLNVRTVDLPLLGSTTLGDDEQNTKYWGHAANSMMNSLDFTELRFYGKTSNHTRVIHFKTSNANCISYFKTNSNNCLGIGTDFTALTGHTANLPSSMNSGFSGQGDNAMTAFPFYTNGYFHWGIGGRWEVDDWASNNTYHQIWVK